MGLQLKSDAAREVAKRRRLRGSELRCAPPAAQILRCGPTGGEAQAIRAGDTLVFPANTTGVWHITETLRKVYVVMG